MKKVFIFNNIVGAIFFLFIIVSHPRAPSPLLDYQSVIVLQQHAAFEFFWNFALELEIGIWYE